MPSTSPLISRLHNQHGRIQGMLSPGKKLNQPGELLHASLSPLASDFAGRKFRLAARRMRSLDPGKLGQTLSGGLTSLSNDILNKFAEIQKISHFNPGKPRRESIWSSLETPLPDTQLSRQETSLESDVMRSGSIIQKMSTVPRPGQSLDSFKDQVQKQPHPKKPSFDKKQVIDKNTRRFSQVQEITPGQKLTSPERPAVPLKSDETQPPVIQDRETPEKGTIQPQPDPTVSIPEKPVATPRAETPVSRTPDKESSSLEMPLPDKSRTSQPAVRVDKKTPPQSGSKDSPVAQPHQRPIKAEEKIVHPPQAQIPIQENEILKAVPIVKKPPVQAELKKAQPVKKEQKEPQKPVARPTLKNKPDTSAAPVRPVIQRQSDADFPPSAPVRPVIQRQPDADFPPSAPVRPAVQQPSQTSAPSVKLKLPAPPAPDETDSGRPGLPLLQNIDYRQNASRSLRVIASDQMKPAAQPRLIHPEDKSLLIRSKHRTTSNESSHPGRSAKKDPAPFQKQDQPFSPSRIPDSLPLYMPHQSLVSQAPIPHNLLPISMPLASPVAATPLARQAPESEAVSSPVPSQVAQISRPTPALAKTNNTIQRTWEGHTPPSPHSSGESAEDTGRSESTDLQALAENVFPFVKRILEIEADRSSGKLR